MIIAATTAISKPYSAMVKPTDNASIEVASDAAYLIEYQTGTVLYSKNEDKKLYPASMTKMMTLPVVMQSIDNGKIKLSDKVTISEKASNMRGSQVFLQPLELMSVEQLIKCVCIASANDAMYALSELVGATNTNFVTMMNDKAKELNLENTNFVNVTGFDDDNH